MQILEDARALHDEIRQAVPTMQTDRKMPAALVDRLRNSLVFDMALPTELGGPGLDPMQQIEVVETLTTADASVGWCAMIGADTGYYPGFLAKDVIDELYPTRGLVTAGRAGPSGKAYRHTDGWRITGRWDFGSGATHADRFVGGVMLHDEDGEMLIENGMPVFRVAYLPTEDVVVHDTWDTVGLRGTGSHDYEVTDAVVPDGWLFDVRGPMQQEATIYRLPWWFITKQAGVSTGLARRALDEATKAATGKMLFPDFVRLIDRPGTLETIARNEAIARSARAYLLDEMATLWDHLGAGGDPTPDRTVGVRLAMVHASQVAVDVTRAMFDLLTTTAIGSTSVFSLLVADAAVSNTHVITNHRSWVPLGARLTGNDPGGAAFFI